MRLGCPSGKISYENREQAAAALYLIRLSYKQKGNTKMPTKYYDCSRCGKYHLTSHGPFKP